MYKSILKRLLLSVFIFSSFSAIAQQRSRLQKQIYSICQSKDAIAGVAVMGIESRDTITFNNARHYPMQSVFKFPIALYVLSKVDEGEFSLQQSIFISKKELLPNTWSPLRDKYPNGNINIPLSELIRYTVAQSDNNGCDILLRLAGGADSVNAYMHRLDIDRIAIAVNEEQMHADWNAQFSNWATPYALVKLLDLFYRDNILSASSKAFLWKVMVSTSTGTDKIKGLLPKGTVVAHKTGHSGKNQEGISSAENDVGIVTLPNGRHFAIAVFITQSSESNETNAQIIARISKAVWDYFSKSTREST